MFDIDATPIDPELLDFSGKNNLGKSGGRGLIYSQERGRYIKPMIPKGKVRFLSPISHVLYVDTDWTFTTSDDINPESVGRLISCNNYS